MTSTHTRLQGVTEELMDGAGEQAGGYDYAMLHTWVQRPASIATCFVKDVYALRAVIPASADCNSYVGRDVFMLDHWPCRMVQLIGWVAGVDHKEKAMVVTLDDGDGEHVLPVTIFLTPQTVVPVPSLRQSEALEHETTFLNSRQRKEQRRAALGTESTKSKRSIQVYTRKDVRVGDTVRVIGRVNEYPRRRAVGGSEWVREVIVDDSSGGSIDVVGEEAQWMHNSRVQDLHANAYSRPFVVPPLVPSLSVTINDHVDQETRDGAESLAASDLASSEVEEPLDAQNDIIKLRDPSKLRSSQLTDATYRHYILDYITQETLSKLDTCLPDFHPAASSRIRALACCGQVQCLFPESNATSSRSSSSRPRQLQRYVPPFLMPYSVGDLLETPHLSQLAHLVVDHVTRQEEKRRRRRIRDGNPRQSDLKIEAERKVTGRDWRLTERERDSRVRRLTTWVIRNLHEDGAIIHLHDGFIPLCPEILFPVLLPFIEREEYLREGTFMRKDDPRKNSGVMVGDVLSRLTKWGEEGRWERVRSWVVEDAMVWAEGRGIMKKRGNGWDLVKGH